MSINKKIKEKADKHLIPKMLPIWKILVVIGLLSLVVLGVYYSINGYLIEVITVLALGFFATGVVLVLVYATSKELFFWIIGKRSEYNKVLRASQVASIGLTRIAIDTIPIGLDRDEKERLKVDVPIFIQMRFMTTINDYIMRVFIGAFAAAFGLLGTIVLMKQNEKIDLQNERVNIQNNLMEAERRSSLVFLMSNILDKVDDEIKNQKDTITFFTDSTKFSLSSPLVSRIVALSRAFRPYRLLDSNVLSNYLVSPERGQLFIALMGNKLDSKTQNKIVKSGDFSNAIIDEINLSRANLDRANLNETKLSRANLQGASLVEANLNWANLVSANLSTSNLSGANLKNANLTGANLIGTNLSPGFYDKKIHRMTNLKRANLSIAILAGANLSRAYLVETNLSGAFLEGANLSGVNLENANLNNTNLKEVDLYGATNLSQEQLLRTASLYKTQNIPLEIERQIRKKKPCLFTKEGCY